MAPPRRRLHRFEDLGHARYLTCSCYRRLPLLSNDAIKDAFVEHLGLTQRALQFDLFAWVIMPEHFHLLLRPHTALAGGGMLCGTQPNAATTPAADRQPAQTVTRLLRRLKAPFGRTVLARWRELEAPILQRINDHRGMPRFWQPGGGYDRNVFTDEELLEKISYIHANPIRRGLAESAATYRWSSARFYEGLAYDGPAIARPS